MSTTSAVIVLIPARITSLKPPGYGVPGRTLTVNRTNAEQDRRIRGEPSAEFGESPQEILDLAETADTQLRTQNLADLREVIEAWPTQSTDLRTAVLAVTRAAMERREEPAMH